jgi:hypothetical protein
MRPPKKIKKLFPGDTVKPLHGTSQYGLYGWLTVGKILTVVEAGMWNGLPVMFKADGHRNKLFGKHAFQLVKRSPDISALELAIYGE